MNCEQPIATDEVEVDCDLPRLMASDSGADAFVNKQVINSSLLPASAAAPK